MNPFVLAASLAALPVPGSFFNFGSGHIKPPQPYDERVTLPGDIPTTEKSLTGAWHYGYLIRKANLESGQSDLMVTVLLTLHEDLSYELIYSANRDLPRAFSLPGKTSPQPHLVKNRSVKENGTYFLASGLLFLEPAGTEFSEVHSSSAATQRQSLPDEKHVWIVRLDKGLMHLAGRCASYQLDPVCRETPIVWYSMRSRGQPKIGRLPR